MIKILHEMLPEWVDPRGSSCPINPETLFYNKGWSEDDVAQLEAELDVFHASRSTFTAL